MADLNRYVLGHTNSRHQCLATGVGESGPADANASAHSNSNVGASSSANTNTTSLNGNCVNMGGGNECVALPVTPRLVSRLAMFVLLLLFLAVALLATPNTAAALAVVLLLSCVAFLGVGNGGA